MRGRARATTASALQATVVDDGVGPARGLLARRSRPASGLSIVRTLVTTELAGTISLEPGHGDGDRPGTEVVLRRRRRRRRRLERSEPCTATTRAGLLPAQEAERTGSCGRSGGAALAGDVLLAQLAALLLGGAAPDAGVLVGGEGELEARRPGPRTAGRRPWRSRSARWPGRWCRRGRTGRGRCPGTGATSRQSSRSMVRCRLRLCGEGHEVPPRRIRGHDEFVTSFTCHHGTVNDEERVRLRWTTVAGDALTPARTFCLHRR